MRWIQLAGCLLFVAGCESTTMGMLPPVVVQLFDEGDPSGWMEIEAERSGAILEIEVEIPIESLPPSIVKAANQEMPHGTIIGAEIEIIYGKRAYEVKKRFDKRDFELVFSPEGVLLMKETQLRVEEAPKGIIRAAQAAVDGGLVSSVEKVQKGTGVYYHVKLRRGGASYKVILGIDGNVLRKVREARVEIEIPLPA